MIFEIPWFDSGMKRAALGDTPAELAAVISTEAIFLADSSIEYVWYGLCGLWSTDMITSSLNLLSFFIVILRSYLNIIPFAFTGACDEENIEQLLHLYYRFSLYKHTDNSSPDGIYLPY